ncbi:hypothetical protein [Mesorhizobium sp. DCY119]|uniref:hypothetical protein n=1 Tax=Mesorhizobium sp. DCY119 TaxID=2108445 RepID=UPI000E74265E|nr:hypothetical protein [Mesorhizobium sp. DCY119]RJG40823.1 hypothetical protein D3Y55_26695 [Mesorhizobium sp. DCY119]
MFWIALTLITVTVCAALTILTLGRAKRATFLPWLDVISYVLTAATVVTLVIATQGQISQAFTNMTGQDLDLGAARTELTLFLQTRCGQEPECAEVTQAISSIADPRGVSKLPRRVDADVRRLPELAFFVKRYNDAFDQNLARNSMMFQSFGFWVSVAVSCGVTIGVWRRVLVLRDAMGAARRL